MQEKVPELSAPVSSDSVAIKIEENEKLHNE